MPNADNILLVYDKKCPVCDYYCRNIDISDLAGRLVRINAREESEIMAEITALGLDVDEGMVLKADDVFYHGAEAIHALALLSSKAGLFNRLASATFRRRSLSRLLYPILNSGRNLLLKMLGRPKVNNLNRPGEDRL